MAKVSVGYGVFDVDPGDTDGPEALCGAYARSAADGGVEEVDRDGKTYRLTDVEWESGVLSGTIWRVRERELPSRVRRTGGDPQPLNLAADEGLGEAASFAFDPKKRTLVMQANHHGPSVAVLREFLRERVNFAPGCQITPRLTKDAKQRLRKARMVRRFEVGLPLSASAEKLGRIWPGLGQTLRAMEGTEGATLTVTVSAGHKRNGLANGVKKWLLRLAGMDEVEFGKLRAAIKEGDLPSEMIDLLGGRMKGTISVLETANREVDHAECRHKLRGELRRIAG